MRIILLICVSIFFIFPSSASMAAVASPEMTELMQPDGRKIQVFLKGDEWLNWIETKDGYTIFQNDAGYWFYVLKYNKKTPVLSNRYAHEKPPAGLPKHLRPATSTVPCGKTPDKEEVAGNQGTGVLETKENKDQSQFPKDPEKYKPMPLPNPDKQPAGEIVGDPETPVSQTVEKKGTE